VKKRRLGNTGLELSTMGLGSWAIGGGGWQFAWGPQDDTESVAAIHRALDSGINWIDTAPVYGLGHSEEVVGRAVKGRRSKVILATKCSRVWEPGGATIGHRLKAESVRLEIEASLRRLQTDAIDLYQIHWPDPEEDIEEGWTEIARAVKAGKIRHAGVSNFSRQHLERVRKIHPVASFQPPYSMLKREVEAELLGWCASHHVGVICYSPMQNGLLTGRFTRERIASLPADDWRRGSSNFKDPALTANLQLVEGLSSLAARSGHSAGQLAIAWVLRRSEVTAAIVGLRNPGQVDELLPAVDWDLQAAEIDGVERLLEERKKKLAL
jgi:aryl-alcohol dehydrogenase-like predicted oxidoreductase